MIAPNVVLTALHCVAEFTDTGFVCTKDGTESTTSPGVGTLGGTYDPSLFDIRIGVEYHAEVDAHALKIYGTGTSTVCTKDLAVMILDRDLETPIVPLRFGRSVERQELVRVVGYGQTETSGTSGRFVRHDISIIDVGADLLSDNSKAIAPYTLTIGEGPCHGDSGGPARSEETGAVLGVYSILTSTNCRSPGVKNVYTQVGPFETLIRKALTEAGYEPTLEPDPTVMGSGGEGGAAPGGAGGAAGDTSVPAEVGGSGGNTDGTGGSRGGSGGTGADGGSSAAGGTGAPGGSEETGGTTGVSGSKGTGSRRDPSCACRTAPGPERHAPIGGLGALVGATGLVVRRRRRRRG
jgi:MYXO-CTERM domain-containing protein